MGFDTTNFRLHSHSDTNSYDVSQQYGVSRNVNVANRFHRVDRELNYSYTVWVETHYIWVQNEVRKCLALTEVDMCLVRKLNADNNEFYGCFLNNENFIRVSTRCAGG